MINAKNIRKNILPYALALGLGASGLACQNGNKISEDNFKKYEDEQVEEFVPITSQPDSILRVQERPIASHDGSVLEDITFAENFFKDADIKFDDVHIYPTPVLNKTSPTVDEELKGGLENYMAPKQPAVKTERKQNKETQKWSYNPHYAFYEVKGMEDGIVDEFIMYKGNTISGGLMELAKQNGVKLSGKEALRLSGDVKVYRNGNEVNGWDPRKIMPGDRIRLSEDIKDLLYKEKIQEIIKPGETKMGQQDEGLEKHLQNQPSIDDFFRENLLGDKKNLIGVGLYGLDKDYGPSFSYDRTFDNGLGAGLKLGYSFDKNPSLLGRLSYGNDNYRLGLGFGNTFTDEKKAVTIEPFFQFKLFGGSYGELGFGTWDFGRWKKGLDGNGFDKTKDYGVIGLRFVERF